MPLNWTEIDQKFTERGLTLLNESIKKLFDKAITFETLNQEYKELEAKKKDPNIDAATRKEIGKQCTKAMMIKSEAQKSLASAPQKIAETILAQPEQNQASIAHVIISEIWTEFPLISRFDLFVPLMTNAKLVELASIIDPITSTNIADIVLPTLSNISALTMPYNLSQSIVNNIALFNFILPKVQNPNLKDKDGTNALTSAAKQNTPTIIKQLLNAGAKIESNDTSVISVLIENFYKNTIAITNLDLPDESSLSLWLTGQFTATNLTTPYVKNFRPDDIHHELREDGYSLNAENALKIVNMCLEHGLDINKFNHNGLNLFCLASHPLFINNSWMIDKIIAMPTFNVNAQNSSGATILSWVYQNNKTALALKLINHPDFNINIAPPQGYGPFIAMLDAPEAIKSFISLCDKGFDLNTQNQAGETLFYLACKQQNIGLAKAIARHPNFDVSIVTKQGDNPLIIALDYLTDLTILDILESRMTPLGIKNFQGFDAFSTAIYHGKLEMAKWIHSKMTLNNPLKESGLYPLHIAVQKGDIEAVKWLLKNSYNANQTSSTEAKITPLQLAEKLTDNKEAIISLLKEHGATDEVTTPDINQQTSDGQTPFMLFCAENNHEAALELLHDEDDNIDITIVDNDGNGPIHYATILSDIDGAKIIISGCVSKGADINARNFAGQTPLIHSLYVGKPDIAIALLDLYSDPMIPDNNGAYPVHIAAGTGQIIVLEKLLNKGADIDYPSSNYSKDTPLKIAKQFKQESIAEWLLSHGAKDVTIEEVFITEPIDSNQSVNLSGKTTEVFEVI